MSFATHKLPFVWTNTLSKSSYIIDFDRVVECRECVLKVEVQGPL